MKKVFVGIVLAIGMLSCAYPQNNASSQSGSALRVIPYTIIADNHGSVRSASYTADGTRLLAGTEQSVILYDAVTLEELNCFGNFGTSVRKARLNADESYFLAVTGNDSLIICDSSTGKELTRVRSISEAPLYDAVFLDDAWTVVTPLDGKHVQSCFILIMTGQALPETLYAHLDTVISLDVDCSGELMLSTGLDGQIQLFNLKDKKVVATYPAYTDSGVGAVFTPDGKAFVSADKQNSLVLRDLEGAVLASFTDADEPASGISFSPDGQMMAVPGTSGFVKVYSLETGAVLFTIRAPDADEKSPSRALTTVFSPDGSYLFTGFENGMFVRWTLNSVIIAEVVDGGNGSFEFVQQESSNGDVYQLPYAVARARSSDNLKAVLLIDAGYALVQESYYTGSFTGDVWFQRRIGSSNLMWGVAAQLGISKPTDDYPYKYEFNDGTALLTPRLYTILGLASLTYNLRSDGNTRVYFGVVAGPVFRFLWNNNIQRSVQTKLYPSVDAGVTAGLDFSGITVTVSYIYNTQIGLQPSVQIGYGLHFESGGKDNEKK
ncbi:MAG: hypothetical protein KBT02_04075 [Treponema sp.]|nr:hypothetical protein [Candidatus Treponema caballi]